jgi:hypothetical protein
MMSSPKRRAAIAAAVSALAVGAAVAGAYYADGPVGPAQPGATPSAIVVNPGPSAPGVTFVPPAGGSISVAIGPTIIGSKMINPGVRVSTTGVSLPSIVVRTGP